MNESLIHHFPPELSSLLVNAIPRLIKGKKDLLLFFKGCGVSEAMFSDLTKIVCENRNSINKYDIARKILERVNDKGDSMLAARREIIKRVTQWEDFSGCYENDRMEAKGFVAEISRVVNVKDSFTRMSQEREFVEQKERQRRQAEAAEKARRREEREKLRSDLSALFAESNATKRGLALEGVLNRLFRHHGILLREDFRRQGSNGEGTVEQIDGIIEIDGRVFLVEMKWWAKPLGTGEVAPHLVRVYNRPDVGGIIISNSGYTKTAVASCKEALSQKTVVLANLSEIVLLPDGDDALLALLRRKVQVAQIEKNPVTDPLTVFDG